MATENFEIKISETGAREVRRNLEDIGLGAKKAESAARGLIRALQGLNSGSFERVTKALSAVEGRAGGFKELSKAISSLGNNTSQVASSMGILRAELLGLGQAGAQARTALSGVAASLSRLAAQKASVANLTVGMNILTTAVQRATGSFTNFATAATSAQQAATGAAGSVRSANSALTSLGNIAGTAATATARLSTGLGAVYNRMFPIAPVAAQAAQGLGAIAANAQNATAALSGVRGGLQNVQQAAQAAGSAAQRAGGQFGGLRQQLDDIFRLFRGLQFLFSTLLGGGAIAAGVGVLNTYQQIENQLRTVTDSTEELRAAEAALFEVSQRTRSSYETNAKTFARVKRATEEMGVSSAEALRITELLNKALATGGATGQERASVMIQLTQAMAAGRFQGDELRSVLENSTVLGNVLAKQMGVTRGELKELGREGKITTKDIIETFRNFGVDIEDSFAKTIPTVSESFTVLRNAVEKAFVQFDRAWGISNGLSQMLLFLSNNLNVLGFAASLAGSALIAALGPRLLGILALARNGIISLTVAAATNPFVALATAVSVAASAIYFFGDSVKVSADGMVTLLDSVRAIGSVLAEELTPILAGVWDYITGGFDETAQAVKGSFADVPEGFAGEMAKIVAAAVGTVDAIIAAFNNLPDAMDSIGAASARLLVKHFLAAGRGVAKIIDFVTGSDLAGTRESLDASIDSVMGVYKNGFDGKGDRPGTMNSVEAAFDTGYNRVLENIGTKSRSNGVQRRIDGAFSLDTDPTRSLGEIGGDLKLPKSSDDDKGKKKGRSRSERELDSILQKADPVLAAQRELARGEKTLEDAFKRGDITLEQRNRGLERLRESLQDQIDPLGAVNRKLDEEQATLLMTNRERNIQNQLMETEKKLRQDGVNLAPQERAALENRLRGMEALKDMAGTIEDAVGSVFSNLGDAIGDFVETGKLDFKGLVNSIISDLARIAIQEMFTKPATEMFSNFAMKALGGFNFGGLGGGTTPAADPWAGLRFAEGGNFTVGGTGGIDSQLVAFKATPGEEVNVSTPARSGKKGGGGDSFHFHFPNADAQSFMKSESQVAAAAARAIARGRRNM